MGEIVGALNMVSTVSDALLTRQGPLGELLSLTETQTVSAEMLDAAGLQPAQWWQTQLHAYHWAIQVSRNL
jgi:EAL and modified HD-GYP domain-containing signal transduction protein